VAELIWFTELVCIYYCGDNGGESRENFGFWLLEMMEACSIYGVLEVRPPLNEVGEDTIFVECSDKCCVRSFLVPWGNLLSRSRRSGKWSVFENDDASP